MDEVHASYYKPGFDRRRQDFAETPPPEPANAVLERRGQVQPIPRPRQRHIQQPLALFALARLRVFVGLRLVIGNRNRRVAGLVVDHPNRRTPSSGATTHVDEKDDREFQSLGGMHRHQADRIDGVDGRVRFVSHREPLQVVGDAG